MNSVIKTKYSSISSLPASRRVLSANAGLEEGLGGLQWELVGCLGLGWFLVYLIVWKGLNQSGKVINIILILIYINTAL